MNAPDEASANASTRSSDSFSLAGKTAIVTGSSSGIGRAIALAFGQAGANVIVHANSNQAGAESTAEQIRKAGSKDSDSCVLTGDIAAAKDRATLVESAFQWQGQVDIWVNNAGTDVLTGAAAKLSFEEKLARLFAVDVQGTMELSRSAGKRMFESVANDQQQSAVILNMGWDQAETGQGGDSGELFTATKGAVMAFTRSLAKSLAPHVRANCLAPGWIRTSWGEETGDYWNDRAKGESLLGRWGQPDDIANAAVFLASPAGQFINGQTVPINGGAQPWPTQLTERNGG